MTHSHEFWQQGSSFHVLCILEKSSHYKPFEIIHCLIENHQCVYRYPNKLLQKEEIEESSFLFRRFIHYFIESLFQWQQRDLSPQPLSL